MKHNMDKKEQEARQYLIEKGFAFMNDGKNIDKITVDLIKILVYLLKKVDE